MKENIRIVKKILALRDEGMRWVDLDTLFADQLPVRAYAWMKLARQRKIAAAL